MKSFRCEVFPEITLGNDMKGEVKSKIIADLGFENIYLATGNAPKNFAKANWTNEDRGKRLSFG